MRTELDRLELSEEEIAHAVGEWIRARGRTEPHTFRLSVEGARTGSPRFFGVVEFAVEIIDDAGTRDTAPPSAPEPVIEVVTPRGGGPARAYVDGRLHVDDPFPWDDDRRAWWCSHGVKRGLGCSGCARAGRGGPSR